MKQNIALFVLLALLFALFVRQGITGNSVLIMAGSLQVDVYPALQGELARFVVNFTNGTDQLAGNCTLSFGLEVFPAVYDPGTGLHVLNRTFETSGNYTFDAYCELNDTNASVSGSVEINHTGCGRSIVGSIMLEQDLKLSNGSGCPDGLILSSDSIVVDCDGHSIFGDGTGSGIYSAKDNISIENCVLRSFEKGLELVSSTSSQVNNNTILWNSYGLYLDSSSGNVIFGNNFSGNSLHAFADAPNQFNSSFYGSSVGNYWQGIEDLLIFDSDSDGYGDRGIHYPYRANAGGNVSSYVVDYSPLTGKIDSDDDGSPDSVDCAPTDPTLLTPGNDVVISHNSSFCSGTYYITDSLLPGAVILNTSGVILDCNGARIVGSDSGAGVFINASDVTLKDCIVSNYHEGVRQEGSTGLNASNLEASNNTYSGITVYNSSANISGTFVGNKNGVVLSYYSEGCVVSFNASGNYVGVYIYYADDNTIIGNSSDNTWYGIKVERGDNNSIRDSFFNNNERGAWLERSNNNLLEDCVLEGNQEEGLLSYFSDDNIFRNLSISDSSVGAYFWIARRSLLQDSTISGNDIGIKEYLSQEGDFAGNTLASNDIGFELIESTYGNLSGETIIDGQRGVVIKGSDDYILAGLSIRNNTVNGLDISSTNLSVSSSRISGNGVGVNITSSNGTLVGVNVTGSAYDGIRMRDVVGFNISSGLLESNSGFGISYYNSTIYPSEAIVLSGNQYSANRGMILFGHLVEINVSDRFGVQANDTFLDVDDNLTNTSMFLPDGVSGVLEVVDYIINNSAGRENRTILFLGRRGGFYGENLTNVTANLLGADKILIKLGIAYPPVVSLVSPADGASSTRPVLFRCNASHEGGLANISLYSDAFGNWSLIAKQNVTGISNSSEFAINMPDETFLWNCNASGNFNNSGFASANRTLTVFTPSGGGGSGGGESKPDVAPAEAPPSSPAESPVSPAPVRPAPAPPPADAIAASDQAPSTAPSVSAVSGEKAFNIHSVVSCHDNISVVQENMSDEDIISLLDIPEGYEIAAGPLRPECSKRSFSLSVMIPDDFDDVQGLKCGKDGCAVKLTELKKEICEGKTNGTSAPRAYDYSSSGIRIVGLKVRNDTVQEGNFSFQFENTVDVEILPPSEGVMEPANGNLRIAGTPIVLKLAGEVSIMNVTLPYILKADEDESSISVYAQDVDRKWQYVGGHVDTVGKVVRGSVNVTRFIQDGKLMVAPLAISCDECGQAEFTNRFMPEPDTREAIILVHGLWGVGKVWDGMVNQFRLTNQPYQLWTFSYLVNRPFEESIRAFADYIEANSHRYDKIHIVGYSLGGLITRGMLRYAYDMNRLDPNKYTFVKKLDKALIVGSPNSGTPIVNYLDTFVSELINSASSAVIPINDVVKSLLSEGLDVDPLPNVRYYVIAGTEPYGFMKTLGLDKRVFGDTINDGLVPIHSAQRNGNVVLNESCVNFWSKPVIHTLLIDDPEIQKIMGQIISSEGYEDLAGRNITQGIYGYSNFFDLEVDDCVDGDVYVVIGKRQPKGEVERDGYCACGNGICDGLESRLTCMEDCGVQEKPLVQRVIERSLKILALIIGLALVAGLVFVIFEKPRAAVKPRHAINVEESKAMREARYLSVDYSLQERKVFKTSKYTKGLRGVKK